jgi:hypothetical protein
MKQLLLIAFTLLFLDSQSQVWCTPGSVWHFPDYSVNFSGYKRLKYLYDTTIAGKTCNKLELFRIGQTIPGYYNTTGYIYTHVNNQVVYFLDFLANPTGFDTLYDFNAVPGDKWRMPHLSRPKCAASYVTVFDTGHVMIQGQWLKSFTLTATIPPPIVSFSGLFGVVYERMGAVDMYPYQWGNVCATSTDANTGGALRCFSDNQISEYKRNYTGQCEYMYVSVNELKEDQDLVRLYPNPTQGLLTLQLDQAPSAIPVSLQITDISGRELIQMDLENGKTEYQVDLKNLSNGVFFISMLQDRKVVYTAKVLKAK